jgi:hypothetical protein
MIVGVQVRPPVRPPRRREGSRPAEPVLGSSSVTSPTPQSRCERRPPTRHPLRTRSRRWEDSGFASDGRAPASPDATTSLSDRCAATAAPTAREASENAANTASPWVSTTSPPPPAIAARRTRSCSASTFAYSRAPNRLNSCVEPSTSVNKNVTAIGTSAPETGGSTSPDLVSSVTIRRVYDPVHVHAVPAYRALRQI